MAEPSTTQPSTTQPLAELTGWLGRGVDLFEFDPFGTPNVKTSRILQKDCVKDESQPGGIMQRLNLGRAGYGETDADSLRVGPES